LSIEFAGRRHKRPVKAIWTECQEVKMMAFVDTIIVVSTKVDRRRMASYPIS